MLSLVAHFLLLHPGWLWMYSQYEKDMANLDASQKSLPDSHCLSSLWEVHQCHQQPQQFVQECDFLLQNQLFWKQDVINQSAKSLTLCRRHSDFLNFCFISKWIVFLPECSGLVSSSATHSFIVSGIESPSNKLNVGHNSIMPNLEIKINILAHKACIQE